MKTKLTKTAYLLLGLGLSSVSLADDTEQKAQQGDANAQSLMADFACNNGDYYGALDWAEKAAKQAYGAKDEEWQYYQLAGMYYKGQCIGASYEQGAPNYPKALEWYSKLAYKSNPKDLYYHYNAKFHIGLIYWLGKGGVTKNGATAKRFFTELANIPDKVIQDEREKNKSEILPNGYSVIEETRGNARKNLASMYYNGDFAAQDYQQAYQWAMKSMQDNNHFGALWVAALLYEGKGVAQNKPQGTELMGRVCDTGQAQLACDLYKKMKAGLPIN